MKFRSASSVGAFLLYFILLVAWFVALQQEGEPMWYLGLAPWYGFGLIFLVKATRYRVDGEKLLVKNPFEYKKVPLQKIRSVTQVNNPRWKQWVTGFPAISLKVDYQDYDEVLLHPAQPEELKLVLQGKIQV